MSSLHGDRKRAALHTVGRATRGLQVFWEHDRKLIIAGTATAREENKIEVLVHSEEENSIATHCTVQAPAEVWSIESHDGESESNAIVTAARRGFKSSVEVWKFEGIRSLQDVLMEEGSARSGAVTITPLSSVEVDGRILKVWKSIADGSNYLALTQTEASVIDLSTGSAGMKLFSVSSDNMQDESSSSKLVDASWIDATTALVASAKYLALVDSRDGSVGLKMNIANAAQPARRDPILGLLPSSMAKITSICFGGAHTVYVGGQDGCIRAFDIRANNMVWKTEHARDHWISSIEARSQGGFVSGGTDGVVKCWQQDSTLDLTFPQHDDTVTNIACSETEAVSISYGGRIAVNEMYVPG